MTNKALQQYVHRSIDAWIQKTGIDNAQKFNDTHDVLYPILEIIPFLSFVNDDSLTHDEKLKQGRIKKRIAIRELIKEYQSSKDSNFHWDILFVTLMKGRVLDFSDRETIYKAACDKKDAFLANIISSQPLFIHAKPAQVLSNIQLEPQAHDETLKKAEAELAEATLALRNLQEQFNLTSKSQTQPQFFKSVPAPKALVADSNELQNPPQVARSDDGEQRKCTIL